MELNPKIREYAKKASETDTGEALDRLIDIYINACGYSMGERCLAVCASMYWILRYKEENPELPEKLNFKDVMALRSEEYRKSKEAIDKYDFSYLDPKETLRIGTMMLHDYKDDLSRIAISMGILCYISFLMEDED